MTKAVIYNLWVFKQSWRNDASIEQKVLLREEVKVWNLESFIVNTFESDPKSVSTKIDEKFHIFDERPVYYASRLVPKQHLKGVRALAEAHCPVIVIRSCLNLSSDG